MTPEHDQQAQLRTARSGSHKAFRALIEPYEAELQRHCYRMTGSVDDADDLVQETLFRAWRKLGTYNGRGSFRAWLYKIATNQTLDLLGSAPRRKEVINQADEPSWLQPYPTSSMSDTEEGVVEIEAIGLAFIAALQNLPGRQRAALILRDVLGYSAVETADILGCTVAAANSALQRARAKMADYKPQRRGNGTSAEQQSIAEQFLNAWKADDPQRLIELLHETAHITMPPYPLEFFGNSSIIEFLLSFIPEQRPRNAQLIPVEANGQPGFAVYPYDAERQQYQRHCIIFFESSADNITKITGFNEEQIYELLNLPETVELM